MNQFSFYTLNECIGEAVYVKDLQDNLVYANKATENITKWPAKFLLNKKCYDIFPGVKGDCRFSCPVKRVITGEAPHPCVFNRTILTAEAKIRHLQIAAYPFIDNGRLKGSILIARDITTLHQYEETLQRESLKRKQLEQYINRTEVMYQAIFEHTGTAMLVIENDRTISMINRELERITGYTRAELVDGKRKWDEFVHPGDREKMLAYHSSRRSKGNKTPDHYEFRLIHASGAVLEVFFTIGMIPGTQQSIGSIIDITERKQTERALQESEEKYRLLLENIEDVFYEVDLAGNFTFVNESVYRVFGFKREELIGRNYRELVDQENACKAFAAYNKVFSTGVPERGFSWAIIRPDGEKRDLEVSVSPIRDPKGQICGFRGTARDITERKKTEDRLRFLSLHDALTGLYNRNYFEEEMHRLVKGRQFPVSLICADVDGLKQVNDSLGHKKGDELLVSTATIIKNALRASDVVARVGGDEFVIILPQSDLDAAESACRRIRDSIAQYNRQKPDLPISISLGCATAQTGKDMANLYKLADDNMYREKMLKHNSTRRSMLTPPGKCDCNGAQ
ncbi:PAS domain S-box protein [Desulfallas thermosapovorans]|uniref:PAS domain S-box-containing protein/diguanylate cyclase (GGDEF)-like protein n=1 Tax=Desulfallas thermosapovorans DSM 6562 TaxID=1121431 RepID=A0A5S4ZYF8_9FIRM|nr:PAS domain S-box protein [Desulfallas thermosapovorans]TYO98052.1 PAS domain S-box-containing protein/diguanylate cyclase (GGDEF)-like protein [Desulfallas thermosapovorans DSM 6562]